MLAAIIVCGLGYAEGAKLSRFLEDGRSSHWRSRYLCPVARPVILPHAIVPCPDRNAGTDQSRLCFPVQHADRICVPVQRLAQGGIAAVGQLQLLQPFFGLALAATFLHETVTWVMFLSRAW